MPRMIAALCLAAAVGCGKDSPPAYRVSGAVTFRGKPVPAGSVTFTPDARKQNTGRTGIGVIQDGRFDTRLPGGKAVGPGPHMVEVTGLENGQPICKSLTTLDLPAAESIHDIKVPDSAVPPAPPAGATPP